MKTLIKALVATVMISCFACHKDESQCQTWEYYDATSPQRLNIPDDGKKDTVTSKVCGDDLNKVSAGTNVITFEDQNIIKYRHYIRRLN